MDNIVYVLVLIWDFFCVVELFLEVVEFFLLCGFLDFGRVFLLFGFIGLYWSCLILLCFDVYGYVVDLDFCLCVLVINGCLMVFDVL